MPRVSSATVDAFLSGLPPKRRPEIERVRDVIRSHLPPGYEEVVSRNMLVYQVPLQRYPDTYNGHPLWYAALASEKSYLSLHLMPVYGDMGLLSILRDGFRAAGKKLDMGKACIHFSAADDLALDVIGEIIAVVPMDRWIEIARAARTRSKPDRAKSRTQE